MVLVLYHKIMNTSTWYIHNLAAEYCIGERYLNKYTKGLEKKKIVKLIIYHMN